MKTKNIRNLVVLGLMLLTVAGCGKYEDGPWMSFRSPEKRIEGTWKVKEFWKNDENLSDVYISNYDWDFWFGEASPENASIPASRCMQIRYNCVYDSLDTVWTTYYFGVWSFHDDDSLHMPIITLPGENPPYCGLYPLIPGVSEFKILKLSNSKMWLEHTKGNDVYTIKFYSK